MNLQTSISDSVLRKIILMLLILYVVTPSSAQYNGYPTRNYTPKDYNGFTQNWDCIQDKRGVLYFGNSSVVLEFDGKNWRKIPISKGVAVRSLYIDSLGIIYVGSVGDFGYLEPQKNGDLTFHSLAKSLPEGLQHFADVWKIYGYKNKVLFQTSEDIFVYDGAKLTAIAPSTSFASLSFTANKDFYVRERQKGLVKLEDDKMKFIPGSEVFADLPILGIIPYNGNQKLILSGEQGFFIMDEQKGIVEHLKTGSEAYLISLGVLGMQWLNDSTIYVNSRSGLIFLNKKLEVQKVIGKMDGLNDETIATVYTDRQGELWLATNNGISRISINSPFYYYNANSGFEGNIQSIIVYENRILIGTTTGMYTAELGRMNKKGLPEKLKFSHVEGTFIEVWNFHVQQKHLYAATSDGVFEVHGNSLERLTKAYANDLSASVKDSSIMYISERDGFRIMKKQGNAVAEQHYFNLVADDIMTIVEFDDGTLKPGQTLLWLTTRNKGVVKFIYDQNYHYKLTRYDEFNDVLKEQVETIVQNGHLYFCSSKGAFEYDPQKDVNKQSGFVKTVVKEYSFDQNGVHAAYWDSTSALGKKAMTGMLSMEESGYTYFQDNSDVLWIGLTNQLVRFDGSVTKNYATKFNALIRKVIIGKDSVLFNGNYSKEVDGHRVLSLKQGADQFVELPYKSNNLTFEYAAPFFEREETTVFSYKLVDFDTSWSAWSVSPTKQYTNLFEGEYTFMVKAKNVYGNESDIAEYKFTILPPWYRTAAAYICYGLLFILLLFVTVKLSVRRLTAAKVKLEKIVAERTAEVVLKKEELQQKNNIIEVAYNDIKSSINYAKRIQESILPIKDEIQNAFGGSFVLFKPRDVVSGDFYWFAKQDELKIIACVDCTGHGVPGAFMSMIGNTLINEIVYEKNIVKPSEILNLLHESVRLSLKQDLENAETRDGMDVALCVVDTKNKKLQYAGANRPLYIVRTKDGKRSLEEIKPDKLSIGGDQMEEDRRFTNVEINYNEGDIVYMSTDGYADQFGGEKGKKFMVKRFHQKLMEIQNLPMEAQGEMLRSTIEEWQGKHDQVDDILVIGIKL